MRRNTTKKKEEVSQTFNVEEVRWVLVLEVVRETAKRVLGATSGQRKRRHEDLVVE